MYISIYKKKKKVHIAKKILEKGIFKYTIDNLAICI